MDDPAFVWDHKVTLPRPKRGTDIATAAPAAWVSLQEAARRTGVPAGTIRNWARKDRIRSQILLLGDDVQRLVALEDVLDRANRLGRLVRSTPPPAVGETEHSTAGPPQPAETPPASDAAGRQAEAAESEPVPAPVPPTEPEEAPAVPEGSLLVPLDAWERMLMQLGNLHQAGQQLAAATERAAKAETEATFLRERVRDQRREITELRAEVAAGRASPPPAPPEQASAEPRPRWLHLLERWERRRRGR